MSSIGPMVIIEADDLESGSPLVLCRVAGCKRTTIEGNDDEHAACGLGLYHGMGADFGIANQLCGTYQTVELWYKRGLLTL